MAGRPQQLFSSFLRGASRLKSPRSIFQIREAAFFAQKARPCQASQGRRASTQLRRVEVGDVALKCEEGALEHGAVGGAGGAFQLVERARAGEFERGESLPARALLGRELLKLALLRLAKALLLLRLDRLALPATCQRLAPS